MEVDVRQVEDVIIVDLKGRLVAGVGDVIVREVINRLLADDWKKILLNLSEVAMIDSSGVGELVASRKISKRFGANLKLVKGEDGVEHVFRIAQILPLFSIYDSVGDALAAFEQEAPPEAEEAAAAES